MLPAVLPPVEQVKLTRLEELKPFLKNVNVKVIVLQKRIRHYTFRSFIFLVEEKPTKDGHVVVSLKVADESGSAVLTLWDEQGSSVSPGDILLVASGFITMFQNEIRIGCKFGTVLRLGRFTMQFSERPDHSSFCWVADPANPTVLKKQESEGKRPVSRRRQEEERLHRDPRLQRR